MINETITVEEFRSVPEHVDAVHNFFRTDAGQRLVQVLNGCEPIEVLSSPHNGNTEHIRDLSIAEKANPDNLLGMAKGYRFCLKTIARCGKKSAEKQKPSKASHHKKVTDTLSEGPKD